MRLNYETVIVGSKCILVPYRRDHVERYHHWMLDPLLLAATASESLSLVEEYEMQKSWRDDSTKCTFIVLARDEIVGNLPENGGVDNTFIRGNMHAMAGDVNLFISEIEVDDYEDICDNTPSSEKLVQKQAELDVMIAETRHLRKGIGREASGLMMLYAAKYLSIDRFFCKIKENNTASLSLFRSFGFQQRAYASCFQEYEFELVASSDRSLQEILHDITGLTLNEMRTFSSRGPDEER
jgi:RimJ/RimL family protein N-acetyltransferase